MILIIIIALAGIVSFLSLYLLTMHCWFYAVRFLDYKGERNSALFIGVVIWPALLIIVAPWALARKVLGWGPAN